MELSDILTLARAGYSRADIEALTTVPEPAQPAPAPAPATAPAQQTQESTADLLAALLALQAPGQTRDIQSVPTQQTSPAPAPAPAPAPVPVQAPAPAPTSAPAPAPAPVATPTQDAAQILRALGSLAQGVAVPSPQTTIEEKIGNTLKLALGVAGEEKKGDLRNGI